MSCGIILSSELSPISYYRLIWRLLSYDSKKETGFVGLKNQGATCYMNSLLQSLFCTRYFRKVSLHVHFIPPLLTGANAGCISNPNGGWFAYWERCSSTATCFLSSANLGSTCWWVTFVLLLDLFDWCLSFSGTTELTKSFGWKSLDSFLQHDVQEFNRVLQDKLESKMKVCIQSLLGWKPST